MSVIGWRRWFGRSTRGVYVVKPFRCERCEGIKAADPESLVIFFDPTKPPDPDRDRRDGERIRTMALAMHASIRHAEAENDGPRTGGKVP